MSDNIDVVYRRTVRTSQGKPLSDPLPNPLPYGVVEHTFTAMVHPEASDHTHAIVHTVTHPRTSLSVNYHLDREDALALAQILVEAAEVLGAHEQNVE